MESLTPQLMNAGRIRMVYPENKAADEHFENLRRQYQVQHSTRYCTVPGHCAVWKTWGGMQAKQYKCYKQ